MPRSDSDAVAQRPTVEQEIAKFQTFSTTNGEVSGGEPTDEEKERIAADAAQKLADGKAAKTNAAQQAVIEGAGEHEETEEEKAAREEREAAETPEEKAARVAAEAAAKKPNKLTAEQRVQQAVTRQRQAERQRDSERAANASTISQLTARLTALETGAPRAAQTQQEDTSGKPDPSKFEFGELDAKYIEALTDWKVEQKLNARQATQQQQTLSTAQQAEMREFTERKEAITEAGREKYDDFDELVMDGAYHPTNNPGGWLLSETLGKLALTSPVGQDVLYHLASDPKEAARVYRLAPMAQAAYFGRIEATFSPTAGASTDGTQQAEGQQQQVAQIKTPKAPPPPATKGKGAGAKTTVPGDTSDFAAFERAAMGRAK